MKRDWLLYLTWAICVTAWITLGFIMPDFADNPISDYRTVCMIIAYLVILGIGSFWIAYLVGLNRHVSWFVLPIIGIGGAVVSYYRVAFHATVTPMIIDATIHTNPGTVAGVVSWQLVGWIALNVLIAILFILWRNRLSSLPHSWLHAAACVILLLGYYHVHDRLQSSLNQRFPYNIIHNLKEYHAQQRQVSAHREVLAYDIRQLPDSIDLIFVLGEAARADHLQLNGYARETTPLLAARRNIVSLPNMYSEYTYTSTSVPAILSPADSLHPERSGTHSSFIRPLQECGFRSAWLSNQDNGRTYVSFIHEADTILFPNASKSVFVFDAWYDEQLLPPLDTLMQKAAARNIYVFHTIGSHWYYNLHVPESQQVIMPLTTNRIITNNTEEQIINSYDNTIRYMDFFVDSLIQRFEDRCAILFYLSDHGEALGEDGVYLHAAECKALHYPACFVWYSDAYAQLFPAKIEALNSHKDRAYRTDFLYPSILSAAGIETMELREQDLFATYADDSE